MRRLLRWAGFRLHVYNVNEGSGPRLKTAQWNLGWSGRNAYNPNDAHLPEGERRVVKEGRYFGRIAKGWWHFQLRPVRWNYAEVEVALGGEDHMVQLAVTVPFFCHFAVGVGIPRSWFKGLIYERRECSVKVGYCGNWLEVGFLDDSHMRDTGMVDYHKRERENEYGGQCVNCGNHGYCHTFVPKPAPVWLVMDADGGDPQIVTSQAVSAHVSDRVKRGFGTPTVIPGEVVVPDGKTVVWGAIGTDRPYVVTMCDGWLKKEPSTTRAQEWPGWYWKFNPRLADRVFGRKVYTEVPGEWRDVNHPDA